jgi:GH24 family phage-related lysozyme (muramidase)
MDPHFHWYHRSLQRQAGWETNLHAALVGFLLSATPGLEAEELRRQHPLQAERILGSPEWKAALQVVQRETMPAKPAEKQTNLLAALYPALSRHEGVRYTRYFDAHGIAHIGIGFNLERPGAKEQVEALGLDYQSVLRGKTRLGDAQVRRLFDHDLHSAIQSARRQLPSFDRQPFVVRQIVANMVFNLGETGFASFRNLIGALESGDYRKAADEMERSRWYGQVGRRSKELVAMMRKVSNP